MTGLSMYPSVWRQLGFKRKEKPSPDTNQSKEIGPQVNQHRLTITGENVRQKLRQVSNNSISMEQRALLAKLEKLVFKNMHNLNSSEIVQVDSLRKVLLTSFNRKELRSLGGNDIFRVKAYYKLNKDQLVEGILSAVKRSSSGEKRSTSHSGKEKVKLPFVDTLLSSAETYDQNKKGLPDVSYTLKTSDKKIKQNHTDMADKSKAVPVSHDSTVVSTERCNLNEKDLSKTVTKISEKKRNKTLMNISDKTKDGPVVNDSAVASTERNNLNEKDFSKNGSKISGKERNESKNNQTKDFPAPTLPESKVTIQIAKSNQETMASRSNSDNKYSNKRKFDCIVDEDDEFERCFATHEVLENHDWNARGDPVLHNAEFSEKPLDGSQQFETNFWDYREKKEQVLERPAFLLLKSLLNSNNNMKLSDVTSH